jgi:thymidylate kinase
MIVVVEGPSAAGKTTWCGRHASRWLPEPGRGPIDQVLRYQIARWRRAVADDAQGELVVLDGDPFKLYYSWAAWRAGALSDHEWAVTVETTRRHFVAGDYGVADLVLYADPGEEELRRRKAADHTRSRRNFEENTNLRPHFRRWYETLSRLDPTRVVWEHPTHGLTDDLLAVGRRASRSDPRLFDDLLAGLSTEHCASDWRRHAERYPSRPAAAVSAASRRSTN